MLSRMSFPGIFCRRTSRFGDYATNRGLVIFHLCVLHWLYRSHDSTLPLSLHSCCRLLLVEISPLFCVVVSCIIRWFWFPDLIALSMTAVSARSIEDCYHVLCWDIQMAWAVGTYKFICLVISQTVQNSELAQIIKPGEVARTRISSPLRVNGCSLGSWAIFWRSSV